MKQPDADDLYGNMEIRVNVREVGVLRYRVRIGAYDAIGRVFNIVRQNASRRESGSLKHGAPCAPNGRAESQDMGPKHQLILASECSNSELL
jgi:hypothetical protein